MSYVSHIEMSVVQEKINSGISIEECIQEHLTTIDSKNPQLNALVRVYSNLALERARELDSMINSLGLSLMKEKFPLLGIPYVLKDNVLVEGLPAQAASKILNNYIAPYSSDVYIKLYSAGAICLGHANMDELAMGSSTEFSGYDSITKNPYDILRVAGGTSGGSAAAVASGMCVFAIGTDTGGSVRQPASFCNLVGVRPTWGTVSRYGIVSTSSSFDQPGVLANSISDASVVLQVLATQTEHDSSNIRYSTQSPDSNQLNKLDNTVEHGKKPVLGIVQELFEGLSPEIENVYKESLLRLSQEFEVKHIQLPSSKYNIAAYYIATTVEAAANFERFDGVRYGAQAEGEMFYTTRAKNFGPEVSRRIMLGTFASSAGYADQYYAQANVVRNMIAEEFTNAFKEVDVIVTPVSPFPAFLIGSKSKASPLEMYLADIMTLSPALAGNASISIPLMQKTLTEEGSNPLPVGLQLVADTQQDFQLLNWASYIHKHV